jgi:hypothetical protein
LQYGVLNNIQKYSLLFCYRMMKACRKAQKVIAFLSIF